MTALDGGVDESASQLFVRLSRLEARLRPLSLARLSSRKAPILATLHEIAALTRRALATVEVPVVDPPDHVLVDALVTVTADLADVLVERQDHEQLTQLVAVLDRLSEELEPPGGR